MTWHSRAIRVWRCYLTVEKIVDKCPTNNEVREQGEGEDDHIPTTLALTGHLVKGRWIAGMAVGRRLDLACSHKVRASRDWVLVLPWAVRQVAAATACATLGPLAPDNCEAIVEKQRQQKLSHRFRISVRQKAPFVYSSPTAGTCSSFTMWPCRSIRIVRVDVASIKTRPETELARV